MELDSNLLKEFAKMTNDSEVKTETKYLRGTIVKNSGGKFVQLDGSTTATPISEIVDVQEGDRVLVTIENHKATIVGNFTFPPSARKEQEAIDKADAAQGTADGANAAANAAQQKAQEAAEKADEAINKSSLATTAADEAKEQATEAINKANSAQANIQEAKDLATQASADATEAKQQAAQSQASSAEAQAKVTRLQNEVNSAQQDIDNALTDLEEQAREIAGIKEEYALSVELDNAKAELSTEITKKVGELQATVEKDYATKTENVELEGRLQTQITQNAEGLTSQATKIEKLEADTTEAQKDVDAALAQAAAAQSTATEAQTKAQAAQDAANAATADANSAAEKAQLAQNAADAATAAANAADLAVQQAQGDLDEAKQNLATVTSRVDATEADIANAEAKVDAAQEAVNEALADAAEARHIADQATEAATQAQQDAETAKGVANTAQQKADNAKTAADNAQAAADKAQQDVAALTQRVTTAETKIEQNSEQVLINANKIVETGEKLDNLEVGARNLLLNTKTFVGNNLSINSNATMTETYKGLTVYSYDNSTNTSGNVDILQFNNIYPEKLGSKYTLSFYAKGNGSVKTYFHGATGYLEVVKTVQSNGNVSTTSGDGSSSWNLTDEWTRYWVTWTLMDTGDISIEKRILFRINPSSKVDICGPKLETGDKNTDWTPAPEDIEDELKTNYYSKTETDAKLKVESDRITSTVTRVETVEKTASDAQAAADAAQEDIDNLDVGGRNYILNSSGTEKKGFFSDFNNVDEDGYCVHTLTSKGAYQYVRVLNGYLLSCRDYEPGSIYTLTYDVMYTEWFFPEDANVTEWWIGQRYTYQTITDGSTDGEYRPVTQTKMPKVGENGCELNKWYHVEKKITIPEHAADGIAEDATILLCNTNADVEVKATFKLKNLKLEKGNKPTDWTPAPEDDDTMVNEAHSKASNAETVASNAQTTVTEMQSAITQLSNMIANLITDENGGSLMTQTDDGWTFNMSPINENLSTIQDEISKMDSEHDTTNSAIERLTNLINEVANKTAYITIATDGNGNPCIELGKTDNDFKVRITNTAIDFLEGSTRIAYANNNTFYAEKMIVKNELQIGAGPGFVWRTRSNGNMGLVYISG